MWIATLLVPGRSRHVSAFAKAYPDTVDQTFAKHWYVTPLSACRTLSYFALRSTWFTQKHVKQLQNYGINTVRIPVR